MCVNFIDLNIVCPKYLYHFPNINRLIYGTTGYKMLSFKDAYSGYNKIKMDPIYALEMVFMSYHGNHYYNIIPFKLKNVGATYQRFLDAVFSKKIEHNIEVYIDVMIIKTSKEGSHAEDLKDILGSVRSYNM